MAKSSFNNFSFVLIASLFLGSGCQSVNQNLRNNRRIASENSAYSLIRKCAADLKVAGRDTTGFPWGSDGFFTLGGDRKNNLSVTYIMSDQAIYEFVQPNLRGSDQTKPGYTGFPLLHIKVEGQESYIRISLVSEIGNAFDVHTKNAYPYPITQNKQAHVDPFSQNEYLFFAKQLDKNYLNHDPIIDVPTVAADELDGVEKRFYKHISSAILNVYGEYRGDVIMAKYQKIETAPSNELVLNAIHSESCQKLGQNNDAIRDALQKVEANLTLCSQQYSQYSDPCPRIE